jgi:hypothetical protein
MGLLHSFRLADLKLRRQIRQPLRVNRHEERFETPVETCQDKYPQHGQEQA